MRKFINRERELAALEEQYAAKGASFVVIYGRRRVGKTTLIREFIKDKPAFYFPASEESDKENQKDFMNQLAEWMGLAPHEIPAYETWYDILGLFLKAKSDQKKILVIDEFPFLVQSNSAFPSILQKIWDMDLQDENVMLILSGSLIHMMTRYALNYESPLYGRRTGQIKLKQIDFMHYHKFYGGMSYRDLVEHYAVTGGVPRYIELFDGEKHLFDEIKRLMLTPEGLLFEEPEFYCGVKSMKSAAIFQSLKA